MSDGWGISAVNLLTFGLLVFAGIQVWVTWAAERTRKRERITAERREREQAFQAVWAEHFRLEGLADQWDTSDLVKQAMLGLLSTNDVRSSGGLRIIHELASLSPEAGYLAAIAGDLIRTIASDIALLNSLVKDLATNAPLDTRAQLARGTIPSVTEIEDNLRRNARQLSLLLWDGLRHSDVAHIDRTLTFSDELSSDIGKAAVRALERRSRTSGPPQA